MPVSRISSPLATPCTSPDTVRALPERRSSVASSPDGKAPDGSGTAIVYTDTISELNYVPYWLQWWCRPLTRRFINRADTEQMQSLARFAEERAGV